MITGFSPLTEKSMQCLMVVRVSLTMHRKNDEVGKMWINYETA